MKKLCIACNQPGTNARRVGASGYHLDCKPKDGNATPAAAADDLDELSEDEKLRTKIVADVQALLPLITRGIISPKQFALLVSEMPGCSDAFASA